MKVYLSGPITGCENHNYDAFEYAEHVLTEQGYAVINPLKLEHSHDKSWQSYMRECIKALMDAEVIVMLDGWLESQGAVIEHSIARNLGITANYWGSMED